MKHRNVLKEKNEDSQSEFRELLPLHWDKMRQKQKGENMHTLCENCGNNYDKAFQIIKNGKEHTFDSFECAINKLAPQCKHCSTKIIGHGVESHDDIYCCVSCAEMEGITDLKDRI